jgi:hypoxanthine phosphoribosyltransferase
MTPPGKIHLTAAQIQKLNEDLGKKISADYAKLIGPGEELLVVITLKGALLFAADLVRQITVPLAIDFVRLASYGTGTKSSGSVRFLKDLETSVEGRHVLILDEIVDSGRSMEFLLGRIEADNPKSVRIAALLSKPSRREVDVTVDYLGTEVEDRFLVGYGLDHGERHRHLPDIYALD